MRINCVWNQADFFHAPSCWSLHSFFFKVRFLCNWFWVVHLKQQTIPNIWDSEIVRDSQASFFLCSVVLSADPRNFQKLQVLEIHSTWLIGNSELLSILATLYIDVLLLLKQYDTSNSTWIPSFLILIWVPFHLSQLWINSSLSIHAWWRKHSKTLVLGGKWDATCRPELVSSEHVTSCKGREGSGDWGPVGSKTCINLTILLDWLISVWQPAGHEWLNFLYDMILSDGEVGFHGIITQQRKLSLLADTVIDVQNHSFLLQAEQTNE